MGSINCKNLSTSSTHDDCGNDKKSTDSYNEYIENAVCNIDDIQENEMKQVDLDEYNKVLLIKQYGKLSAIGTKCTHYSAPLINGVLGDGRVKCPWHGACFNTTTGDIEDFPGLNSLPCYNVHVDNGKIYVRAKKTDLEKGQRIKPMAKYNITNNKIFVIIGGGPAGGICAETLRQEGYTGHIILMCREYALPYDRVKLTKAMNIDLDKLQLRTPEFYIEHSIDIMLGVSATKLSVEDKIIYCSNGEKIKYDKVFIATGSDPIKIPIPGSDNLENIMTIRNHADSQKIEKLINKESNIICLGSSFISLESAALISKKVKSVSVIFRSDAPLKASFGKDIGYQVIKLFEENGVKMYSRNDIVKCMGNAYGKICAVLLKSGETKSCDLLILGTGTRPSTEFLNNSGVNVSSVTGSIDTDIHLMAAPDVYVGGDIANAPILSNNNKLGRIAHYQLAQYHGKIAAANMAGKVTELKAVPFFWTQLFGKNFRYTGAGSPTEIAIKGKINDYNFVIYYMDKDGFVYGMASCGRDPIVSQFAEFLRQGKRLHKNDLAENPYDWIKQLNKKC